LVFHIKEGIQIEGVRKQGTKTNKMRVAVYVARMGEMRNAHKMLVRKPEGKRPLGKRRHRWEDSIRIHVKEVE
jgi:hypothetical protein